jgi:predicted GNAT superfamily acetyltransferase|tara:strand:+ start:2061 stop:2825 length:765 start_codon:yes stop_codon:yes gene_type:complete
VTRRDKIEIRELATLAEMKRAEALQVEVWGEGDIPENSDLMLAMQHEGGLVAGGFLDGRLLGFLFGFPSSTAGVQHSHRLAVHPDSRGLGLGTQLKWFQRDWCLARDITLVRWTYDPLRRVNANLNIARLGATAGTYFVNYYGEMMGINAGVPSDRLLAEWQLDSPWVQQRADNVTSARQTDPAAPAAPTHPAEVLRAAIPADFPALLSAAPDQALIERLRLRAQLMDCFQQGYRIVDFDRDACCYLLAQVSPA